VLVGDRGDDVRRAASRCFGELGLGTPQNVQV
jgi:hypothetical protein